MLDDTPMSKELAAWNGLDFRSLYEHPDRRSQLAYSRSFDEAVEVEHEWVSLTHLLEMAAWLERKALGLTNR